MSTKVGSARSSALGRPDARTAPVRRSRCAPAAGSSPARDYEQHGFFDAVGDEDDRPTRRQPDLAQLDLQRLASTHRGHRTARRATRRRGRRPALWRSDIAVACRPTIRRRGVRQSRRARRRSSSSARRCRCRRGSRWSFSRVRRCRAPRATGTTTRSAGRRNLDDATARRSCVRQGDGSRRRRSKAGQ